MEEFHGDRLSSAGKVYHPGQYKKKSRKSAFIDSIAKNISQLGLSEEQQAAILGTSLGVAHSINALTKEGQRQQQPVVKPVSPPPSDLDLRVNSFDYDITGQTPEQILGKRFAKLRFPSESARLSTLRSIFQKVVDDPRALEFTKKVCLSQLGQFDYPKFTKQEVEHYLSRTISRLDQHHDPDLIPPPDLS